MEMTPIAQAITIAWCPHPLLPTLDRLVKPMDWRGGETVREILERSEIDPNTLVSVSWQDRLLTIDEWDTIIPQANDLLLVHAEMAGGGGGGSNPLKLVMMIALMVVGNVFGAALGSAVFGTAGVMGTTFGGVALSTILGRAVISIAGNLILGALFRPSGQTASSVGAQGATASPTYSLQGGSNRMRPYEPMPVVLGQHRIFPDLGAAAYTEYQGDDQYLYQIFHFGLSDIALDDFRIGETPISSYSDLVLHWPDKNGVMAGFPGNVDTTQGATLTAALGWVSRTSGQDAISLSVDLEGLFYSTGESIGQNSADFEIEYRRVGDTDWQPFVLQDEVTWGESYWSLGHWQPGSSGGGSNSGGGWSGETNEGESVSGDGDGSGLA